MGKQFSKIQTLILQGKLNIPSCNKKRWSLSLCLSMLWARYLTGTLMFLYSSIFSFVCLFVCCGPFALLLVWVGFDLFCLGFFLAIKHLKTFDPKLVWYRLVFATGLGVRLGDCWSWDRCAPALTSTKPKEVSWGWATGNKNHGQQMSKVITRETLTASVTFRSVALPGWISWVHGHN